MGLLDGPLRAAIKTVTSVVGTTGVLTRTVREYDPRHSESFPRSTTHTLPLVLGKSDAGLVNADATEKTQLEILVESRDTDGVAVEPDAKTDTFTLKGAVWRVFKVAPVHGSGEVVAYKLTLQK